MNDFQSFAVRQLATSLSLAGSFSFSLMEVRFPNCHEASVLGKPDYLVPNLSWADWESSCLSVWDLCGPAGQDCRRHPTCLSRRPWPSPARSPPCRGWAGRRGAPEGGSPSDRSLLASERVGATTGQNWKHWLPGECPLIKISSSGGFQLVHLLKLGF